MPAHSCNLIIIIAMASLSSPTAMLISSSLESVVTGKMWWTSAAVAMMCALPLVALVAVRRARRRGRARLPPGSEGVFPLVGETLQLIKAYKTESPESFIDKRVRAYGRVFRSHVFGERTVFSADPEVNRLVLQNEGRLFECSYPSSIVTLLGRRSLLLTSGAYHRRMHSLTLSSFSNPAVLRDALLPDIQRVVRRTLCSWPCGDPFSLLDQAKKITFELAVGQLISGGESADWTERLRKEYVLVVDGFFSVPLSLPFTTYGRALRARAKVAQQIRQVVRKRMEERVVVQQQQHKDGDGGRKEKGRDVLETLLAEGVTDEDEAVDFVLALLVAAYETTPTAMTVAVKFLTETPAALAALREEHDNLARKRKRQGKRDGSEPDEDAFAWSDYKTGMPFTHSVINETLRVANLISGVFRRATTDVHVKGYVIPKGCKVFASFRAVHMDEDHFQDARTFNPWRWQTHPPATSQKVDPLGGEREEGAKQQQNRSSGGNPAAFCVFGGGARLCPGYELARVELCVFLHHLLTTFSWDAADDDKLVFFPTTRTLKGYPIRVRRRRAIDG